MDSLDRLVAFSVEFTDRALDHEDEQNFDHESSSYKAYSYAYDTVIQFINNAIEERNNAIDGDAICEFIDSEFPRKGENQEYTDELEAIQFIVEDIVSEMHL